jgi:hypothetical protein
MSFITFAKNDILRELGKNREDVVYYDELIDSLIKYFRSEYPLIRDLLLEAYFELLRDCAVSEDK